MLVDNSTVNKLTNLTTGNEVPELSENSTRAKIIDQFKNNWAVKDWTQGFFNEEYIYEINIHWLQFSPPSTTAFFVLGILYILIMTIGIFGNCLVIFMFIRCKSLRTPGNKLIVNLATSDAIMLIKTPVFIYNCFYKGPILGDIACRLYGFLGGLTGITSILTLAAISLDRYFVIKYPLSKTYSSIRINLCLICSWVYAFAFSVIPFLNIGYGKYQYEGYLTSCSFDYLTDDEPTRRFILILFSAAWVVPVSMILFSYYMIVQVVRGRSLTASGAGKRESFRHVKEEDARKQEIKLAVIVLTVISLWFISWTPYATVALLGISGQKHLITPLGSMIPALFCKMTSAVDPYVYAISHPKFREELKNMLGIKEKKKTPNNNKVWSTEPETKHVCQKPIGPKRGFDAGIDEEVVEIELKAVTLEEAKENIKVEDLIETKKKLRRQASVASILCPNPNFSNKTSNFRRISRKLASLSKPKSEEEEESQT